MRRGLLKVGEGVPASGHHRGRLGGSRLGIRGVGRAVGGGLGRLAASVGSSRW